MKNEKPANSPSPVSDESNPQPPFKFL